MLSGIEILNAGSVRAKYAVVEWTVGTVSSHVVPFEGAPITPLLSVIFSVYLAGSPPSTVPGGRVVLLTVNTRSWMIEEAKDPAPATLRPQILGYGDVFGRILVLTNPGLSAIAMIGAESDGQLILPVDPVAATLIVAVDTVPPTPSQVRVIQD